MKKVLLGLSLLVISIHASDNVMSELEQALARRREVSAGSSRPSQNSAQSSTTQAGSGTLDVSTLPAPNWDVLGSSNAPVTAPQPRPRRVGPRVTPNPHTLSQSPQPRPRRVRLIPAPRPRPAAQSIVVTSQGSASSASSGPVEAAEQIELDMCPVCQDDIETDDTNVHTLANCNHTFHKDCLIPWVTGRNVYGQRQENCPTCRAGLSDADKTALGVQTQPDIAVAIPWGWGRAQAVTPTIQAARDRYRAEAVNAILSRRDNQFSSSWGPAITPVMSPAAPTQAARERAEMYENWYRNHQRPTWGPASDPAWDHASAPVVAPEIQAAMDRDRVEIDALLSRINQSTRR